MKTLHEFQATIKEAYMDPDNKKNLRGMIDDHVEDLRRKDTIGLSFLWSLMCQLMEEDTPVRSDSSCVRPGMCIEEAFIVLLVDFLMAYLLQDRELLTQYEQSLGFATHG